MTANNMNPKNLMILAALGIGAYFLTMRRAGATTTAGKSPLVWAQNPTRAIQPSGSGTTGNILSGLFSAANILLGGSTASGTQAIPNNDLPGQPGYGWQYFNDGTSIAPDGSYYKDGAPIWSPSSDSVATNPADSYTTSGYPTSYQSY